MPEHEHYVLDKDNKKREITDPGELATHLVLRHQEAEEQLGRKITCKHDYPNALRLGHLQYACPDCGEDITMGYVLFQEALQREEELDEGGR